MMKKYLEFYTVKGMVYPRIPYASRQAYYYVCIFFSPWTTHLVEVFTRKGFGIRHFNLGVSLRLALILALLPLTPLLMLMFQPKVELPEVPEQFREQMAKAVESPIKLDLAPYMLWYVFICVFVYMCMLHWFDQKKRPSIFEKPEHTKYAGRPHKWFFKIKSSYFATNIKTVECYFEPLLFLLPGILFFMIGQKIGLLFIITAILYNGYSLSNYWFGQQGVYDTYDKMIEEQWNTKFLDAQQKERSKRDEEDYREESLNEEEYRKRLRDELIPIPAHRTRIITH